jgi:hypothetical protein
LDYVTELPLLGDVDELKSASAMEEGEGVLKDSGCGIAKF